MKIIKNLLLLFFFTLVSNPTIAEENVLNIGLIRELNAAFAFATVRTIKIQPVSSSKFITKCG